MLATQQVYEASLMPGDVARPFAEQWLGALGEDATWLVNGDTSASWQPVGHGSFETAVACVSTDRVALLYVADED